MIQVAVTLPNCLKKSAKIAVKTNHILNVLNTSAVQRAGVKYGYETA